MPCSNANTPSTLLAQTTAEAAVLCLINDERMARGIPPLTLNLKLRAAARQQANDAKALKWWAGGGPQIHINPVTGSTPQDRIRDAGYCPTEETLPPTNENGYDAYYQGGVQYQSGATPQAALTWWMNSPPHRNTLLDPTYRESGVAVVLGIAERGPEPDSADGGVIVVQTFGGCSRPETPSVGEVWAWGKNIVGELGDGTTTDRHMPVHLEGVTDIVALAGCAGHSLALHSDGSVLAWGRNFFGQLGDGTTTDRLRPIQVPSLTGVRALAGANIHSLALMSDGSVMAWGGNYKGQLGDGSTNDSIVPIQVPGLNQMTAVSAGWEFSLALRDDGTVWAWGTNNVGQLGDGTTTNRPSPLQVAGLRGVKAISAGFEHCLALKDDGTVWAWGTNIAGQLGNQSLAQPFSSAHTPVQVDVPSGTGPIVAIAAGGLHSMGLEQNGRVWTWGDNSYGQLGNGMLGDSWVPVPPVNLYEVTDIAAGFGHNLVLKRDGTVWAWGMNVYGGAVGDNTTIDRSTPVPVLGLPPVVGIACGTWHSLAM